MTDHPRQRVDGWECFFRNWRQTRAATRRVAKQVWSAELSPRSIATVSLAAAITALSIIAHFIAELTALGDSSLDDVIFADRHRYLICAGLGVLVTYALVSRALRPHLHLRVSDFIRLLPFGGKGLAFIALVFGAVVTLFFTTQLIEGCPIRSGDLIAGLFVGLLVAALGSVALALFERCFSAVTIFLAWISAQATAPVRGPAASSPFMRFSGRRGAYLFSFANRPPPDR